MAKRRSPKAVLEETADSFALLNPDAPDEPAAEARNAAPAELTTRETTITVPLRHNPVPRYMARHVEVQLDSDHAATLAQLLEALDHAGERLKSGRRVASSADGLRWLLEQIAAGSL